LSLASLALNPGDSVPAFAKGGQQVGDVGRSVLAPDKGTSLDDLAPPGGGVDLLAEMADTVRGVVDRECVDRHHR